MLEKKGWFTTASMQIKSDNFEIEIEEKTLYSFIFNTKLYSIVHFFFQVIIKITARDEEIEKKEQFGH